MTRILINTIRVITLSCRDERIETLWTRKKESGKEIIYHARLHPWCWLLYSGSTKGQGLFTSQEYEYKASPEAVG